MFFYVAEGAYSQEDFSDNETESGHTQLTKNIIAESKNKRKQSARPGLDFSKTFSVFHFEIFSFILFFSLWHNI